MVWAAAADNPNQMDVSSHVTPQKPETGFLDRLGGRFLVRGRAGETVEILIFRDELVSAPGFEAAVRGTVARLAGFRHPAVRRVRGVARLAAPDNRLALVSDSSPGARLSEFLLAAERDGRPIDMRAALYVVRETLAAVHAMHEASGGLSHGALGPERIVVTPEGRIVVVEHVLGQALECHTAATQERFWWDYRLAVREESDAPRFGPRTDVLQCGLLALSLVLGRLLRRDEYPRRIGELLLGATESGRSGSRIPLGLGLRAWLARALQLGSQDSFVTVAEAQEGFEQMLAGFNGYAADPAAVRAMLVSPPGPIQAAAAPDRARDSGARAAAPPVAPAELARPTEQRPAAAPVTAGVRGEGTRQTTTAAVVLPAPHRPVQEPPPAMAASMSGQTPELVSIESLSTPPGVECIAAEVRPAATPTPRSGPHRLTPGPLTQHKGDSSRFPVVEAGITQAPRVHPQTLFGATEADEAVARASAGRRRTVIGAAAAGLILVVAGVPGIWLLSRQSAQPPAGSTLSLESRPAASETGADRTSPERPQAGGEGTAVRPAGESRVPGVPAPAGSRTGTPDAIGAPRVAKPPVIPDSQAVPPGARAPVPPAIPEGEITVAAPLPMQILEKGTPLGSSPGGAISLPAGRHDIELVNESIGYRETHTVYVAAGKIFPIVVILPMGTMSVNALPWAEVWVDGQKVGETPVGNLEMAVGPHEIVFRHPQLGERRQTVVVTVTGPLRVSVDLRKQP